MKATILLVALVIVLLSGKVNSVSSVNVTRLQSNDEFTNPNHAAVSSCLASGQSSSFVDSCKTFHSTNTRAKCLSSTTCCGSCQCEKDYPIYLAHLGKCVNLDELNSDVFGPGSTGCGGRLEIKGKGGDDDDDDDDDDRDGKKDKDVCKAKNWTPPLIDFQKSSDPKIEFCLVKPKDTERCNMQTASYLGFDQWRNLTSFQQRFWTSKNKKDMYLQWNDSAVSHLTGNIVVIKVSCKEKGPKGKYFTSCFMFKTAGTHVETKTLATTTKPATTKPTTRNPATTKPTTAKPALPPTTTTETTTKNPATTKPTTAQSALPTTTTTKTTTKNPATTKPTTAQSALPTTTTTKTTTKNPATTKPTTAQSALPTTTTTKTTTKNPATTKPTTAQSALPTTTTTKTTTKNPATTKPTTAQSALPPTTTTKTTTKNPATTKPTTAKPALPPTTTTKTTTKNPATTKPTTAKPALPPTTTTETTTKSAKTNTVTTTNPATKITTKLAITTVKPVTATKPVTTKSKATAAASTTKAWTTEIDSTTKSITRTATSFSETTSKEIETTSFPETEPKQKSSEITMTTIERRSPGNDKILDTSRDHSSSRSKTVVVVPVLCTLVALAALSFMIVYLLRKWKRPKKSTAKNAGNSKVDKPESNDYQTQDNVYQLLRYDGKSTAHGQWEPPVYQGLAKSASEGNWGVGEVYTNPSMYQDLKKNEAVSNEYLPAYHPLMKSTMEKVPEYDCGYLVLVGEHDKQQDTADLEDPYYFKVEQTIE